MRFGDRCLVSANFLSYPGTVVLGEGGSMICEGDNGPLCDMLPDLLLVRRGLGGLNDGGAPMPKFDMRTALKPFASVALLNASNSGFWSRGITRGEAAAVDRTVEVGGLQFLRACCPPPDESGSCFADSRVRPK